MNTYDKEKNPFLLQMISSETNNTIVHEIAVLITKKTIKPLFYELHTILNYHPELAAQANGTTNGVLPANLITENLTENEWDIFWNILYNPMRHAKPESYFLEKIIKTKPIEIKLFTETVDNKNQEETKVKKTSSFTIFSFSHSKGTSRSNSLITLPLLKEHKN